MTNYITKFWTNKWLLSILAGIMLGFSFPPFPFPFLQFPAFIFIFRLIALSHSARQAAYYVYPGFLIWNVIVSYWLMMASLAAGIAAILANAVLMSLVVMLQFKAQERIRNGWMIALLQTAFWVTFEYLHHQFDLSWPWLTLGNGWSNAVELIQYISMTGFWGISVWVMLSSALIFQGIQRKKRSLKIGAVIITVLFPALSLVQLSFLSTPSDTTVETVIVQPNFDSYEDLGGFETPEQTLDLLFNLSDSVRTPQTDVIIWPENSIYPYLTNRDSRRFAPRKIKDSLQARASAWNTSIIGGTAYVEYFSEGDHPALPKRSGNGPYLTYNAAVGFYPDQPMEIYRKHNLVTVVERFPFVHFFNAIDVFNWVNWSEIQNFGKGNNPTQFRVGETKTPALICYDSVYPGWIRKFVQNGAGFITVITNDGWWGDTSGHEQHFAYARLRAIEFRRWVVRSANNGISGVIGPTGSVKKRTEYWTRTAFNYDVPILTQQTMYARFGDWLPIGLMIISVGGLGFLFFPTKK